MQPVSVMKVEIFLANSERDSDLGFDRSKAGSMTQFRPFIYQEFKMGIKAINLLIKT